MGGEENEKRRIAEDLEERHDGKAKEAPKSKLQTRRGVLPPLRWYRVLREWQASGTGYPASKHSWV